MATFDPIIKHHLASLSIIYSEVIESDHWLYLSIIEARMLMYTVAHVCTHLSISGQLPNSLHQAVEAYKL